MAKVMRLLPKAVNITAKEIQHGVRTVGDYCEVEFVDCIVDMIDRIRTGSNRDLKQECRAIRLVHVNIK